MSHKLLRKAALLLLPFSLILSSCNGANEPSKENKETPKLAINRKDFDPIDYDGQTLNQVDIPNPDLYSNTFRDVDPNFTFKLKGISHIITEVSYNSYDGLVSIVDHSSKPVTFSGQLDNSTNMVSVNASTPYQPGRVYTATLNDDTLQFHVNHTIHESVRQITFTVKEEDKDNLGLKEGIRTLPLDHVLDNSKDPLEPHKSLLYKGDLSVSEGEVLKFASDDQTRVNDTLYIKVVSSKAENGNTRISYNAPEPAEILDTLDVHTDDKLLECNENNFHLADEGEMYHDLVHNELTMDYVAYTALAYGFADNDSSVVDFIKSCTVTINFKFIDGGISVEVILLFKHKFESGWVLALNVTFQWQETYRISADAELETVAGIPTGVDMSVASEKTDKISVKGSIIFSHSTFNPGPDWDDPKSLDLNKAKQAVEQLKDKWAGGGMFDSKRERTESGVTLFNIGWVEFYFGYVSVSIEFYLYLTSAFSISLGFGWTYENTTTIIDFSTGDGNKGGSASPSGITTNVIDVELVGKYYLEFGFKVRFCFFITGLKWIINLQIDLDGGIYLDAGGFGGFVANITTGDISVDVGFLVEIGFVLRVTVSVVIFGRGYGNWQIWSLKKPLISFGNNNRIEDHVDETVNLHKEKTRIDDTNMMKFTVFDGAAMLSSEKTFKFKEKLTIADSVFWDEPIAKPLVISCTSADPSLLSIVDDEFVIAKDAPKLFDTTVTLEVSDVFAAKKHTYSIPIHYQKEGTKVVTFDGANSMAFEKGEAIEFPVLNKDGQIFKAWQLDGKDIDLSKPYLMGDKDINFTSRFIDDVSYLVEFYDGYGNLISSSYVQAGEAATEPDEATRDAKMEGYKFVSWDVDLSHISSNTQAHAIYVKVGEVD